MGGAELPRGRGLSLMRIASYNVENLFNRAKALDQRTWADGRPVLEAFARAGELLEEPVYTDEVKREILRELTKLGLRNGDLAKFARLRQNRGRLLKRARDGRVEVIAGGRADWIGWVELTFDRCEEQALVNTARVILELRADVLGVVEAESRHALKRFTEGGLRGLYRHIQVMDGNDERGIDVGVMSTEDFPLAVQRTHVDDVDEQGRVFSRDCPEYHFALPGREERLVVLVNHLKSKGYGGKVASDSTRRRQAARVAAIYKSQATPYVAVVGDLNDTPDSEPLAPLLRDSDLRDVSKHPAFDDAGRPGTYGSCTARNKLDYVLLSPALWAATTGGGILRKGVWGGRNGVLWPIYDTMTRAVHAGSDHAAIFADIDLNKL
ncbi:endonuclease/exonuclease/phosphatase family protein [Dactylosporangium sp. CS-033363]|uniref:endonuclease/exonuclease/phosphatase family protein n=1 Tax=Dactylosporangium sp. CS-033363 TaxID=3239935 RepID=UPI003D92592C